MGGPSLVVSFGRPGRREIGPASRALQDGRGMSDGQGMDREGSPSQSRHEAARRTAIGSLWVRLVSPTCWDDGK